MVFVVQRLEGEASFANLMLHGGEEAARCPRTALQVCGVEEESSAREKRGLEGELGAWEARLLSMGKCEERFQSSMLPCPGVAQPTLSAMHPWLLSQDWGADNGGARPWVSALLETSVHFALCPCVCHLTSLVSISLSVKEMSWTRCSVVQLYASDALLNKFTSALAG